MNQQICYDQEVEEALQELAYAGPLDEDSAARFVRCQYIARVAYLRHIYPNADHHLPTRAKV